MKTPRKLSQDFGPCTASGSDDGEAKVDIGRMSLATRKWLTPAEARAWARDLELAAGMAESFVRELKAAPVLRGAANDPVAAFGFVVDDDLLEALREAEREGDRAKALELSIEHLRRKRAQLGVG